jgi:hypothetical protein
MQLRSYFDENLAVGVHENSAVPRACLDDRSTDRFVIEGRSVPAVPFIVLR